MTAKMILQGGPLDGEQQIVLDINTTPGFQMQFAVPHYQTFAADAQTVLNQGLVAIYAYQGAGPGPGAGDTWTKSGIYNYVAGTAAPPLVPPPITPGVPPQQGPAIWMGVQGTLTVNANDPGPGVQMVGEGDMSVDGTQTTVGYATISMTAETTLEARSQTSVSIAMISQTSLQVDGSSTLLGLYTQSFEDGTLDNWGHSTDASALINSTTFAQNGTHSLDGIGSGAGGTGGMTFYGPPGTVNHANTNIPIDPTKTYVFSAWFRASSTGRPIYWVIYWFNSAGTQVDATQSPALGPDTPGGWTYASFTTPASQVPGVAYCQMQVLFQGCVVSEGHFMDSVTMGVLP